MILIRVSIGGPAGGYSPFPPAGSEDQMIYPVSIFNHDGKLQRLVLPKDLSVHYWSQFGVCEKSRKSFVMGSATTKINRQIRKFKAAEQLCDQFIFDFGV